MRSLKSWEGKSRLEPLNCSGVDVRRGNPGGEGKDTKRTNPAPPGRGEGGRGIEGGGRHWKQE